MRILFYSIKYSRNSLFSEFFALSLHPSVTEGRFFRYNKRTVPLLRLCQPHCLIFKPHVQLNYIVQLIHHNLAFVCLNVIHNFKFNSFTNTFAKISRKSESTNFSQEKLGDFLFFKENVTLVLDSQGSGTSVTLLVYYSFTLAIRENREDFEKKTKQTKYGK